MDSTRPPERRGSTSLITGPLRVARTVCSTGSAPFTRMVSTRTAMRAHPSGVR